MKLYKLTVYQSFRLSAVPLPKWVEFSRGDLFILVQCGKDCNKFLSGAGIVSIGHFETFSLVYV